MLQIMIDGKEKKNISPILAHFNSLLRSEFSNTMSMCIYICRERERERERKRKRIWLH